MPSIVSAKKYKDIFGRKQEKRVFSQRSCYGFLNLLHNYAETLYSSQVGNINHTLLTIPFIRDRKDKKHVLPQANKEFIYKTDILSHSFLSTNTVDVMVLVSLIRLIQFIHLTFY